MSDSMSQEAPTLAAIEKEIRDPYNDGVDDAWDFVDQFNYTDEYYFPTVGVATYVDSHIEPHSDESAWLMFSLGTKQYRLEAGTDDSDISWEERHGGQLTEVADTSSSVVE
jgi:hypothetical protein